MILAAPFIGQLLTRLWNGSGTPGRIGLIGAAVSVLGSLIFILIRRALRKGGRNLLRWITAVSFVLGGWLGSWVKRVPEARGSSFILWHQLVRVGAAL